MKALDELEIVSETVAYKRYLKVFQRTVKYPDENTVDWYTSIDTGMLSETLVSFVQSFLIKQNKFVPLI